MFVIAGRADCPRFARAEMLADQLAASLLHFRVHKVSCSEPRIDEGGFSVQLYYYNLLLGDAAKRRVAELAL